MRWDDSSQLPFPQGQAVARSSYVDPRVVTQYEEGRTIAAAVNRHGDDLNDEDTREALERSVARLLTRNE